MRINEPIGAERPISELLRELTTDTAMLVRQELDLAQAEIMQQLKYVQDSAGFFATGSIFAVGAFGALTIAFVGALAMVMHVWTAALIVAIVYGAVAALASLKGKERIKYMRSHAPKKTLQSVRQDMNMIRSGLERGRS